MFCRPQILKKLMKSSFKKGVLVAANTGEEYYLHGEKFKLICKAEFVPNSILAQLMELAGEIPMIGECFCAGRDGNQMVELQTEKIEVPKEAKQIIDTDILIEAYSGEYQRVVQFDDSKEIYLMNEMMYQMVDPECIDRENGEISPIGPLCDPKTGVYYINNVMTLQLLFNEDCNHEELIKRLEKIYLVDRG